MVLIVNATVFAPDLIDQVVSTIPERWISVDSIMTIIGTLIGLFSAVTSALGITLAITKRWALILSALYAAPYAFGAVALAPVFGMGAAIYMMGFIYVFSMGFVWLTYQITRTKP
jgi:hypothetical protein